VGPPVVDPVQLDHPAAGTRLHVAGKDDPGDELAVLIDVGVGQEELGQGEQQLAPPLDRSRVRYACGLGRSVGLDTSSIEAVPCLHQTSEAGSPTTEGKTRNSGRRDPIVAPSAARYRRANQRAKRRMYGLTA
jgi:hypothetical protein